MFSLPQIPNTPHVLVIFGPTASGKTALSLQLANHLGISVLSADSRQIYRYLDIGTGKVTPQERGDIVHYGIDILDPREVSDAYSFREYARSILSQELASGRSVILCGGTGLYIDMTIFERDEPGQGSLLEYREELEAFRLEKGNDALWRRLHELAPMKASQIHPSSFPAIIRALELLSLGIDPTLFSKETPYTLKYPTLFLTPKIESREWLYNRINTRIHSMFELGFVSEVESLVERGYGFQDPGMNSIGYREIGSFLRGEISLSTTESVIAQKNRNYAKRQITWNKKYFQFGVIEI